MDTTTTYNPEEIRKDLWEKFREEHGPRPMGVAAQSVWEKDWDAYMVAHWPTQPKSLGCITCEEDEYGGYMTIGSYLVPKGWNDTAVDAWVGQKMPAEHCQHSYDCCGRTYGGKGRWKWGPEMYMSDWALITVARGYRVNI